METQRKLIETTEKYIKNLLESEGTGHDWWHIDRVRTNALAIASHYPVNVFVVEMAALLHDIADHKFHDGDENIGPKKATELLTNIGVEDDEIQKIVTIIREISFSKGLVPGTLEGKIVQDADRLDALGAIGIARAFAYGGHKQRLIYHPDIPPTHYASKDEYKKSSSPTINHFYEKLLLLTDLMNTGEAKKLAAERHKFMELYLNQFFDEWKGVK